MPYAPFGESYSTACGNDPSFGGMNQDTTPGMYDAAFRRYHPVQGRWISPDPSSTFSPINPQTFNQYAYVRGNPLSLIDPQGLDDGERTPPPVSLKCPLFFGCGGMDSSSTGSAGGGGGGGSWGGALWRGVGRLRAASQQFQLWSERVLFGTRIVPAQTVFGLFIPTSICGGETCSPIQTAGNKIIFPGKGYIDLEPSDPRAIAKYAGADSYVKLKLNNTVNMYFKHTAATNTLTEIDPSQITDWSNVRTLQPNPANGPGYLQGISDAVDKVFSEYIENDPHGIVSEYHMMQYQTPWLFWDSGDMIDSWSYEPSWDFTLPDGPILP